MTETAISNVPQSTDPVIATLIGKVCEGIEAVEKANEILLAEEKGTPVREIDKALKAEDTSEIPSEITAKFSEYEDARAQMKTLQDEYRNLYRTQVLGEEAQTSSDDEEKDALKAEVKEHRDLTMDTLKFLANFASLNGHTDVANWATNLAVPQVGRKGTSSAGGSGGRKHRVFVTVNGETHNSFTEAALAMTSGDKKYAAGDLAEAWVAALGENDGEFELDGNVIQVAKKVKGQNA